MKTKHIILVLSLIVFNSCIVKSLNPFYTDEVVEFSQDFVGEWKDNNKDVWKITSIKQEYINLKKREGKISKEDEAFFKKYEHSYSIEYSDKNKKSLFIATPFKLKNQLFLDFIPYSDQGSEMNSLLQIHNIYPHSLVKLDILNTNEVSIKWFDEKRLKKLFTEKRIKIKHQKIGVMKEDILLTATSEELQQFLKKYMSSDSAKKWETETKFTLKKS
ncbi:hypothetical protein ACOSP6_05985 [Tenacibaculum sp. MEBiC06402]|uniref:hypothetical protein n=1 Tax=unclassified Tenacibaculum TaxID=2635139 RepID=UPI003B9D54FA